LEKERNKGFIKKTSFHRKGGYILKPSWEIMGKDEYYITWYSYIKVFN
jgi:hypothetical protein